MTKPRHSRYVATTAGLSVNGLRLALMLPAIALGLTGAAGAAPPMPETAPLASDFPTAAPEAATAALFLTGDHHFRIHGLALPVSPARNSAGAGPGSARPDAVAAPPRRSMATFVSDATRPAAGMIGVRDAKWRAMDDAIGDAFFKAHRPD